MNNLKKIKWGVVFIVALIISLLGVINKLHKELKISEYNLKISDDKTILLHRKNNELLYTTKAYKADKKELKKCNDSLYNEVKKIKGDVITLNHIIFNLKQDTTELRQYLNALESQMYEPVKKDTNTWEIPWKLFYDYGDNNFDHYIGSTTIKTYCDDDIITITHEKTEMLERSSVVNLIWGQRYTKDGVEVYVLTKHPALKINNMSGVFVKYPKKKHWFTGFGIGPAAVIGYDFMNNQPSFVIGLGLQYNIYQW